ncbi:homocitrate synthase [Ruminiclostridium papyrosolvens]|uniref:Homocitrate synthase n=1 Tax=Ruminiclostridium papyrosolvens C7 TaxID=1330534 RepID=U4R139_9FIRM|nr:homocitrate synthase [Ruminiclostridium papyrosolvens]EPR11918.1 homocitrate synthase [Ruminiclostridium papyrosolvens C7]
MKEKKYIIDTTLRDGEQTPGYAFSKAQKVELAKLMDDAGIYQIEAGIPAMGNYEKETICEIMSQRKKALISTWNRMSRDDINNSFECRPDIIHITAPISYIHIYSKLNKNKTWLKKTLQECVFMAKDKGYEVTVGFEDASRADITFIISMANLLSDLEVKSVRFADTVGVLTPSRTHQCIREIIENVDIPVGIHAHNDLGMALANSLIAAKAGALYIDTTIAGIGERAGNCDLYRFITAAGGVFNIKPCHSDAADVNKKAQNLLFSKLQKTEVI